MKFKYVRHIAGELTRILVIAQFGVTCGVAIANTPEKQQDRARASTNSAAPFSIGAVFKHATQWSRQNFPNRSRDAIIPSLHFDGIQWIAVSSLDLTEKNRKESIEPQTGERRGPSIFRELPDVPLEEIEKKANVPVGAWSTWHSTDLQKKFSVTGAWRAWPSCQPQWALATDSGINWNRVNNTVFATSAPVPLIAFKRTQLTPNDPMRAAALARFRTLNSEVLVKADERVLEQSKSRFPKNVAALEKFPLRWWRTYCSESAEDGARVCQLVARRRFDGKTSDIHDIEPVEYVAWIQNRKSEAPRVYRATAAILPIWETFAGTPPGPDKPIALVSAGGKRWVWFGEELLEGNAQCVHAVETERRAGNRDVCMSWGC